MLQQQSVSIGGDVSASSCYIIHILVVPTIRALARIWIFFIENVGVITLSWSWQSSNVALKW